MAVPNVTQKYIVQYIKPDIDIYGVQFRSIILLAYFPVLRASGFYCTESERIILTMKEGLNIVSERSEGKVDEISLLQQFRDLLDGTSQIHNQYAIPLYVYIDFLGGLENFVFYDVDSMDFFLFLIQNTEDRKLAEQVWDNLNGKKTDYLGPVPNKMFPLYLKALTQESKQTLLKILSEHKDSDSIHNYAFMLDHGQGGEKDKKKARELYWLNWEENKNNHSLNNYAYLLHYGLGGEKDEKKARELYWLNWEENKNSTSLHNYADMLQKGLGGEEDEKKARELHWMNWEENKNKDSLGGYIHMLKNGIGGEKNEETAQVLQSYIN